MIITTDFTQISKYIIDLDFSSTEILNVNKCKLLVRFFKRYNIK